MKEPIENVLLISFLRFDVTCCLLFPITTRVLCGASLFRYFVIIAWRDAILLSWMNLDEFFL